MRSGFCSQLLTYFITCAVQKVIAGSTTVTVPEYFAGTSVKKEKERKK